MTPHALAMLATMAVQLPAIGDCVTDEAVRELAIDLGRYWIEIRDETFTIYAHHESGLDLVFDKIDETWCRRR